MQKYESKELFNYFIQQIDGISLDNPVFRAHGWEYYKFSYNNQTESFCVHESNNKVDATFNGKYLTEGLGLDLEELIKLYKSKISLFSNSVYKDILITTNMEFGEALYNGMHCIGWRKKMSYSNGFKYSNIFRPVSKLAKCINENRNVDISCNKVWQYIDNHDIFLISSNGYNFITTIDLLAEDLQMSPTEILELVK